VVPWMNAKPGLCQQDRLSARLDWLGWNAAGMGNGLLGDVIKTVDARQQTVDPGGMTVLTLRPRPIRGALPCPAKPPSERPVGSSGGRI
jgi:hypothetical protein